MSETCVLIGRREQSSIQKRNENRQIVTERY
jgi:hypothetical protein